MPWIDPGWLDRKTEIAETRDTGRRNRWRAAPWYIKILIWFDGDSPNGANHRMDWK
jgi:hypothetical protein